MMIDDVITWLKKTLYHTKPFFLYIHLVHISEYNSENKKDIATSK